LPACDAAAGPPSDVLHSPPTLALDQLTIQTDNLFNPFINEFALSGGQIAALPVPFKFLPSADQSSGIRNNLAFASLTATPDGRFLTTAVENTLFQDGPAATLDNEDLAQVLQYDLIWRQPVSEFIYLVEPIPAEPVPADAFAVNGLVELLALENNGTLLAIWLLLKTELQRLGLL